METVNETARIVVFGQPSELWREDERVCLYKHDDVWYCSEFPQAQYCHFSSFCDIEGFAQQAEAGRLLVKGIWFLAEEYLALWRAAFKKAIPVTEMQDQMEICWDVSLRESVIAKNSDRSDIKVGGLLRDPSEILGMASPYTVDSVSGWKRWIFPFGETKEAQIASALKELGSVRYKLAPGSYCRLMLRQGERKVAREVSTPIDQLNIWGDT